MGLSCSCDDFDKGDCDHWWEPGRKSVPPAGTRCCECCAPLPAVPLTCINHMEVYEPDEIELRPPHPEDVLDDEPDDCNLRRHWRQRYDAMEAEQEDYDDRHGWESDYERYERLISRDYRCERCEGLADAIEDMGYCMIGPGELAECHTEYVNEIAKHSGHAVIWRQGKDGIWNPRPRTKADDRRDALIRFRRRWYYRLFRGGWKHDLRWKVWEPIRWAIERRTVYPVMTFAAYHKAYDYEHKRLAWRKMGPEDGMVWIRRQMQADGFTPGGWHDKYGNWKWHRKPVKETA